MRYKQQSPIFFSKEQATQLNTVINVNNNALSVCNFKLLPICEFIKRILRRYHGILHFTVCTKNIENESLSYNNNFAEESTKKHVGVHKYTSLINPW